MTLRTASPSKTNDFFCSYLKGGREGHFHRTLLLQIFLRVKAIFDHEEMPKTPIFTKNAKVNLKHGTAKCGGREVKTLRPFAVAVKYIICFGTGGLPSPGVPSLRKQSLVRVSLLSPSL